MEENGTAPASEAVKPVETAETAETVEAAAPAAEPSEAPAAPAEAPVETVEAAEPEEISYHAVEKEGHVAAIWEMQGRKHLRTIDPRSSEGKQIMELYTAEVHE